MADTSPSLDSSAILIGALMPTRRSADMSRRSEPPNDWIRGVWSDRENLNPLKSTAKKRTLIKLIDGKKTDNSFAEKTNDSIIVGIII